MSEELMLKCLIAFILGYFLSKHMGNRFSVGGAPRIKCDDDGCRPYTPQKHLKCDDDGCFYYDGFSVGGMYEGPVAPDWLIDVHDWIVDTIAGD